MAFPLGTLLWNKLWPLNSQEVLVPDPTVFGAGVFAEITRRDPDPRWWCLCKEIFDLGLLMHACVCSTLEA